MTKDQIHTIFMQRGFTIKEGQDDLKEYVYEAANDLIRAVQQEIAASAPNPSDKQEAACEHEWEARDWTPGPIVMHYAAPLPQSAEQDRIDAEHPDDEAVDRFASAMKEKMAAARAKGRGGWEQCPPEVLSRMLREHIEKGDPRDVANFCMMLWHHQSPIAAPIAQSAEQDRIDAERYRHLCEPGFIPRDFEKQIDAEIAKGASK